MPSYLTSLAYIFTGDKMKKQSIALLLTIALITAIGCAVNPVTQRTEFVMMSEAQEIDVGRRMDPEIKKQYGVYACSKTQKYVSTIGRRIAEECHRPDLFFHFTVLDSPMINAFALPGGYIYVTRGIMAYLNSEAELAGVLGHEIGHVTARHSVRQYSKGAAYQLGTAIASVFIPGVADLSRFADFVFVAILSGYSREYEMEADRLGVEYAVNAGYDPMAMSDVLQTIELLNRHRNGGGNYTTLFSTHPTTERRIDAVDLLTDEHALRFENLKKEKDRYLTQIDGIVFGDDIKHGVVVGNSFKHPDMRIQMLFPENWDIDNRPESVIAKKPEGNAIIELRFHRLTKRTTIAKAASEIAGTMGLNFISGNKQRVNGITAYIATYEGRTRQRGYVMVRAGFFLVKDIVYFIIGYDTVANFNKNLQDFNKSIESFQKLTLQEAQKIEPVRLRLHTVQQEGDTIKSILKKLERPMSEHKTVCLINKFDPDKPPFLSKGTVIKVLSNE